MSSSSSTTPADEKRASRKQQPEGKPSVRRDIFTWVLLLLWLILISFGVVSTFNPQWLQELSRPGIDVEARNYKNYGDEQLRRHDYLNAIVSYQEALRTKPGYIGAVVNLAIALGRAGEAERGVQALKTALQEQPAQSGVIQYNLAQLLESQGKTDEAVDCYKRALHSDMEEEAVLLRLGILYFRAREYGRAKEAFQMTLAGQLDPRTPYRNMLRQSVAIYEDDPDNLPIIEEQLTREIRDEDLEPYDMELFLRMQQTDPNIAQTHHMLGAVSIRMGDIKQAIEHFEKSLQIRPGRADVANDLRLARQSLQQK